MYRLDRVNLTQKGKLYNDANDQFIREPFYAGFKAGNFDFILITVHILYGHSENARIPEITALTEVYKTIEKANPNEKDIIVLGDFNLAPDNPAWQPLKNLPTMKAVFNPPLKTTITDTSLYDNFW